MCAEVVQDLAFPHSSGSRIPRYLADKIKRKPGCALRLSTRAETDALRDPGKVQSKFSSAPSVLSFRTALWHVNMHAGCSDDW